MTKITAFAIAIGIAMTVALSTPATAAIHKGDHHHWCIDLIIIKICG